MRPVLGVALALALVAGCRAGSEKPVRVLFPDMYVSVPYDPYDPNLATRNGQTLLVPPEGSVPIGFEPFSYGPGPDEAKRAGAELHNPLAPTPASLARAQQVYRNVCIVCHGPKGEGDGPIIGRFPNPPSLLAAHAKGLPDGQIVHIIARGQGIMPPHAAQVRPADRWRLVFYLRQLQGAPVPESRP